MENFVAEIFNELNLPERPAGLYSPIRYALSNGGKRLRPTLLAAAVKALGGDVSKARYQCLGIEMFHNFTLLHDDVMDNSEMRRGQPTVHCRWNENTAILSGDAMLTLATVYMSRCDDRHLRAVLDVFNATAMEVYEGQQLDMDFENRDDVTVHEYLEMITLKTSVLLACALKIGAVLADASPADADAMYLYGKYLGLGFQLRDDYLDTFGDPDVFGKQIGRDIIAGKKTWLMIMARAEDKSGTMDKVLDGNLADDEKVRIVTGVYRSLKLDTRILSLIKSYSDKAVACIEAVDMTPEGKRFFRDMASRLNDRMI